jgi:kynurenine formamidase
MPFPGVSLAMLQFLLLQRNVPLPAHEPLDTDDAEDFAGDARLLQHNYVQAEGVANLDQVPAPCALVTIGFARLEGGTGSLARYVAVAPASWPHETSIAPPGSPAPCRCRGPAAGRDGCYAKETN